MGMAMMETTALPIVFIIDDWGEDRRLYDLPPRVCVIIVVLFSSFLSLPISGVEEEGDDDDDDVMVNKQFDGD
jgi:hypothetical protein